MIYPASVRNILDQARKAGRIALAASDIAERDFGHQKYADEYHKTAIILYQKALAEAETAKASAEALSTIKEHLSRHEGLVK